MLSQVARWALPGQLGLAFVLGAVTVLAFAPFGIGLVALFAPAGLLFLLWHAKSPWASARLGYAFGLGLMGFGIAWLRISINQFGGVTPALAILATALFVAIVAVYFGLFAWLLRLLARGVGKVPFMLVLAPLLWFLIEWLRSWLFTGFPWLSLGYSQLALPLGAFAPVLGVFGVSALLVFSAGLLNLLRRLWPALVLLGLWGGGLGLDRYDWTDPSGDPVEVALVQGAIKQQDKWRGDLFSAHVELYRELSQRARQASLLVWPETAIAAFDEDVEQAVLQPLHTGMQGQGKDLLTGIVVREEDGRYFNAMLNLGESGRQQYLKRHLVPFGEYLPLQAVLGPPLDFLQIPMSDFSPGDQAGSLLTLANHPVGVSICYEDAFASEVMRALPEAAFLVNASNDAWFGDSLAPHQHLQIARMRARESGRFLLRATNTGISAIIDQRGGLRGVAPQFEQAVLTDRIQPMQGSTPYVALGDGWLVALSIGIILLMRWRVRRVG